jgi:hypothetical protein
VITTPTVAEFLTHARRFGPECVVETARDILGEHELRELEVGLVLSVGPTDRLRQRRTTADLAGQVRALFERGLVPSAIADALNISDRRVAGILSKSRTSENGGRKRLNQAEKNAAKAEVQPAGRRDGNGAHSGAPDLDLEQPRAGRRSPAGRSTA